VVNGQILCGGVEFANSSSQWEAKAYCSGLINKKQDILAKYTPRRDQDEWVSHLPQDIQYKNKIISRGGASEKFINLPRLYLGLDLLMYVNQVPVYVVSLF
jgi:hypothetical protein